MDGYQRRTLGKKVKIIQAAVNRLSEAPEDVTISSLAASAAVSPVSIYNYFGSKEALLQLAVLSYLKQYLSESSNLFNQEHSYPEKLKLIIQRHANAYDSIHPNMISALKLSDERFESRLDQLYDRETSKTLDLIIEEGRSRSDLSGLDQSDRLKKHLQQMTRLLMLSTDDETDFELFFYGFLQTTQLQEHPH